MRRTEPTTERRFGRGRTAARRLARVIDASAWLGARSPTAIAHGLATVGGTLEWALRPAKRRLLAVNIGHAVAARSGRRGPDDRVIRRLVRREIRNEAHRSADLLWALGRPEEFLATVELDGIEYAQQVVDSGQGLILLGTHIGGWEVATVIPGAFLSAPTSVVVADDWLGWAIEHARAAAGLRVLYSGRAALEAVRLLKRGEILLLLGDDGRHGTLTERVRFLDSEADLAAGPVRLSRLAQVPIVGFTVVPLGVRRWKVIVDPPVDPPPRAGGVQGERRALQEIADRWTDVIREWPDHWSASFPISWHEGSSS